MNPLNVNDPGREGRPGGSRGDGPPPPAVAPDASRAEAIASMYSFLGMSALDGSDTQSAGSSPTPPPLLVDTQDQLNSLLRGFEDGWNPELLAVCVGRLPAEGAFRRLGLTRLIKI